MRRKDVRRLKPKIKNQKKILKSFLGMFINSLDLEWGNRLL